MRQNLISTARTSPSKDPQNTSASQVLNQKTNMLMGQEWPLL